MNDYIIDVCVSTVASLLKRRIELPARLVSRHASDE